MSELRQRHNEDSNYFRKTSRRTALSYQTEEIAEEDKLMNSQADPSNYGQEQQPRQDQSRFTVLEKLGIVGIAIIILLSIALNLLIQYQDTQVQAMIDQYNSSTDELTLDSNLLLNEIMEQYNYDAVQEAAKDNGMSIDESRVKDVSE